MVSARRPKSIVRTNNFEAGILLQAPAPPPSPDELL